MLDSRRMLSCVFVCLCVYGISCLIYFSIVWIRFREEKYYTSVFLKVPNNEEFFRSSRAFKGRRKFTVEVLKKNNWIA